MNTARDRLAARLEFTQPGEKRPDEPAPPPTTRPVARTKRVRRTVDLSVQRHHALKTWCDEQALAFGLADVPGQHVLDELVGLLLSDMRTREMVIEGLRKRYEGT